MDVTGPHEGQDVGASVSPRRRAMLRQELAGRSSNKRARDPRFSRVKTDLQRLQHSLREIPDIRGELVARATARLREEYYNTRESAERTAAAILQTLGTE